MSKSGKSSQPETVGSGETYSIDPSQINEETINQMKLSMDPSAIPDLGDLLDYVNDLITFVETPKLVALSKSNYTKYEETVYQRYNQYMPIKIIGLLVDENERYDNLATLLDMFDKLDDVKVGKKNMQTEYENFSEKLNEKYLYPDFGGKEQFIETMKKTATKPQLEEDTK